MTPKQRLLAAHVDGLTAQRFRAVAGHNNQTVAKRLRQLISRDVSRNWREQGK